MRAKKSLGQHFLNAPHIAESMARLAAPVGKDPILEVGPGKGILTRALLAHASEVIAIEKDRELIPILQKKFENEIAEGKLKLIEGDVRDLSDTTLPKTYQLVANIPYYITGEIIRTFLTRKNKPSRIILLVQDEVAKRIAREKKESILSISVKAYGVPRYVRKVPRSVFKPVPSVDSAILCIEHISANNFKDLDEEFFFRIVRAGFASKRKMLMGNLLSFAPREKLLEIFGSLSLSEKIRAEEVKLQTWLSLAKILATFR